MKKPKKKVQVTGPRRVKLPSAYAWADEKHGALYRVVDGKLMTNAPLSYGISSNGQQPGVWYQSVLDNRHAEPGASALQDWQLYAAAAMAIKEWQERKK